MPMFKYFDVYSALCSLIPEPSLQQSLSIAKCGFVAFPLYFLSPANLAHPLFHDTCFSFSAFLACGAHISGGVSKTSVRLQSVWQSAAPSCPSVLPFFLSFCRFALKVPSQIDVIYQVVETEVLARGRKFYVYLPKS